MKKNYIEKFIWVFLSLFLIEAKADADFLNLIEPYLTTQQKYEILQGSPEEKVLTSYQVYANSLVSGEALRSYWQGVYLSLDSGKDLTFFLKGMQAINDADFCVVNSANKPIKASHFSAYCY